MRFQQYAYCKLSSLLDPGPIWEFGLVQVRESSNIPLFYIELYVLGITLGGTVYPKKYAHGFCFAVLCCGYTLTDLPISIRLTSLALWQSNDCPSASKATLMNMDKYFMWIHYERLHNHNKAKHNKTVCIFLGINCILNQWQSSSSVACSTTKISKINITENSHDDVIKWKHFPRYWPFVRGIHRWSRWIPHTKASDAELWCFLWSASK